MKTILGMIFLLFFSCAVFAEAEQPAPESISEADFSKARISIAGPGSVYMRGIEYGGTRYSAVITAADESGETWQVTAVYEEEENMAPPSTVLDLAEITPVGDDTLVLRGIVVEDRSYAASFSIDRSGRLTLEEAAHPADMPEGFIDKLGSFKNLLMGAAEEKYAEQLETLEDERMDRLQRIAALAAEKERMAEAVERAENEAAEARAALAEAEEAAETAAEDAPGEDAAEPEEPVVPVEPPEEDAADAEPGESAFPVTLMEGFVRTAPQLGSWEVTAAEATQIETDQYFAKLLLPLGRQPKPTLYSFQTRSRSYGWTGAGMQILSASDPAPEKENYGFDNSLLIWLTRDPEFYGSGKTRLQLFRSDESVKMELVLDAVINEPLSEYLDVEILWEPMEEYITISVNGIEKLKYKTWFGAETELEVALRSLGGGVDFKSLKVLTRN